MTARRELRARLSGPVSTRIGAVLAALVAWPILAAVLPHGAPAGIMLLGLIYGGINALLVVSIILVYRANRFINFAAAEFGAVAAIGQSSLGGAMAAREQFRSCAKNSAATLCRWKWCSASPRLEQSLFCYCPATP